MRKKLLDCSYVVHLTKADTIKVQKFLEAILIEVTCYEPDLHLVGLIALVVKGKEWIPAKYHPNQKDKKEKLRR